MKNFNIHLIIVLLTILTGSISYSQAFKVGSGSEYRFVSGNTKSNLSIYISESSFTQLGVEYYFANNSSLIPQKMWQQYKFKYQVDKPLELVHGYLLTSEFAKPKKMTNEVFSINDGVKIEQFLFSKASDLKPYKIASEVLELPAGEITATHYRKKNNGQIVDFWISESVKPIGLVKLVSKSKKDEKQNYTIELDSLLKGVKARIKVD